VRRREFLAGTAALAFAGTDAFAAGLTSGQRRALRDAVRGHVYFPGGHGYNAAKQVFNRRFDGVKPPAVVRVRDAADVVAAVKWADRFDIPLVARSGGHSYTGQSTSSKAVVIDLGGLSFCGIKGVRGLLELRRRHLTENRRVHFVNVKPHVRRLFEVTGEARALERMR
jgi:hypothetical protein